MNFLTEFKNRNNPNWIIGEIWRLQESLQVTQAFIELADVEGATYYLDNLLEIYKKTKFKIYKLEEKLKKLS